MTCIVGIEFDQGVLIAGDKQGTEGNMRQDFVNSKLIMLPPASEQGASAIAGYSSSYRMGQILENFVRMPDQPEGMSDISYLVSLFIPKVISAYKDNGSSLDPSGEYVESRSGYFILGYKGRVYSIGSNYSVLSPRLGYCAEGSGEQVALGNLFSFLGESCPSKDRSFTRAHACAREALRAAYTFNSSVGGDGEYIILYDGNGEVRRGTL